ncbi:DEAD/DEAH box helicase [Brevundimonas sp.]|uniref:DEAD/DEAH box helicase n=1 Tax=Brevundimonas sp. TaxID=1871086 RepID=UPI00289D73A1|nr:DEAD/DEAH box helicase [Brevundimonas sp.]
MTRTYGSLTMTDGIWVLSGLEPHVKIKLKSIFTQIPRGHGGPYRFADVPDRCADLVWFETRYPMAMSAEDRSRLTAGRDRFEQDQAELEAIKSAPYYPPVFAGLRDGQVVREHQARAVALLERVGGLLVGDEVGEGKSYTTAAACLIPGALPAVIVCLPHLKEQWAKKLREFTTLSVEVLNGTDPRKSPTPSLMGAPDVRILAYSQLSGWADVLSAEPIGLVAFDEMQELRRGREAEKGRAAHALVAAAQLKLGLTATPIYNYGGEIFTIMEYLRPEVLGDPNDFHREWCTHLGSGKYRVNDPHALGSFLRDCHAFTRKVKDRPNAPNILVRAVGHSADELNKIEDVARALARTATTGHFTARGEATRELDMRVRQATGVAKATYVASAVRMMIEAGEPLILFGWHRDVYDIWMQELADLKPVLFTGTESPKAKAEAQRKFVDGETDLLIMSLRSGAGIDELQHRASTVVFGELDWSPGIHHQCIGRLDREGQICWPDPVTALYLVAEDGSDPPIMEVLGLKASQSRAITDPTLGVQAVQSDDAKLKRLITRYLQKEVQAA